MYIDIKNNHCIILLILIVFVIVHQYILLKESFSCAMNGGRATRGSIGTLMQDIGCIMNYSGKAIGNTAKAGYETYKLGTSVYSWYDDAF